MADLEKITVPDLTIGGQYDTMDSSYMEKMANLEGFAQSERELASAGEAAPKAAVKT